jgi:phage shock protein A
MDTCSDGHEEIVYDGRYCPVCELVLEHEAEITELTDEMDRLNDEISNLEEQISDFEDIKDYIRDTYPDALI